MFDIGFWELMIIGVVALVVVGPERFPGMLKQVAYWVRKFRRIVASVKTEIVDEVDKAEQLQNLLDEQKEILKRHVDVNLGQPAVKPRPPEEEKMSLDELSAVTTPTKDTSSDVSVPPQNQDASTPKNTPPASDKTL